MVSRTKLYDEVWAEPMTKVAARHEVSSSFLARVCDRMNVPRPPRGYWKKLEVGKAPPRPELPAVAPGDLLEWWKGQLLPAVTAPRPLPQAPAAPARPRRRPNRPALHPLVAHTKALLHAAPAPTSLFRVPYLMPAKRKLVDIVVTKEQLDRAAALMSELLLECEDRGYRVSVGSGSRPDLDPREQPQEDAYFRRSWHPSGPTVAYVGTVPMGLTVYELTENVEARYVDGKYVRVSAVAAKRLRIHGAYWSTSKHDLASGRLAVRAYAADHRGSWSQTWKERAPGDLPPSKMVEVVRELGRVAPTVATKIAEAQRQADLRRQERERQERAEHLKRLEREREQERLRVEKARHQVMKDSHDELVAIIEELRRAMSIETFFQDATTRAAALPQQEQVEVQDRVDAARKMLGGTDALTRFRRWRTPEERFTAVETGDDATEDE